MPLPNPDPSLPSGPTPVFNDVDAVRGDQLRANNQAIWANLQYLFDFTGRTTGTLTEGSNLYYTDVRAKAAALAAALTGYSAGSNTALSATDTILQAMAKIQGQITARLLSTYNVASWNGNGSAGTVGSPNRAQNLTITRLSSGKYSAAFSSPQPDAYYNPQISISPNYTGDLALNPVLFIDDSDVESAPTTSGFYFQTRQVNGTLYDPKYMMVTVTR